MAVPSIRRFATAALAVWMLAGCSTVQVEFDSDPDVDFAAYRTFWQTPPPQSAAQNMPGYSTIAGDHIQAAIAHALERKGLRSATQEHADLIVAFSIDGQPRQDVEWSGGWGGWYGGSTYSVDYVDGTLTIDLFDAEKKKLVWHGFDRTHLYGGGSKEGDRVDDSVEQILKQYPPKPSRR